MEGLNVSQKKRIDQLLDEYNQEQEWGSCLDCGDDAFCVYDEYDKGYSFSCHNEDCPHHWPKKIAKNKEDVPDWFAWPLP